jgi:hypothetical protein
MVLRIRLLGSYDEASTGILHGTHEESCVPPFVRKRLGFESEFRDIRYRAALTYGERICSHAGCEIFPKALDFLQLGVESAGKLESLREFSKHDGHSGHEPDTDKYRDHEFREGEPVIS